MSVPAAASDGPVLVTARSAADGVTPATARNDEMVSNKAGRSRRFMVNRESELVLIAAVRRKACAKKFGVS